MNNERIDQTKANLSGLGTKADEMYTNQQLVDVLKEFQSALAKGVFEKTHAENLRERDLVLHFEALAKEYGLDQTSTFLRLKSNLNELGYTIGSYIKGLNGERVARKALKLLSLDKSVKILYNVQLEDEDAEAEYDAIAITPYGLFVIEVKNWGPSVVITQDGIMKKDDDREITYDLAGRMSIKQALLKEYIGDSFPKHYQSILMFPDDRVKVENHYNGVLVCCGGGISYKIQEFTAGEDSLTAEQIMNIEQTIRAHHVVKKAPSPVNCDEIIEDYATLMVCIEDASAAEQEKEEADICTSAQETSTEKTSITKWVKRLKLNALPRAGWKKTITRVASAAVVAVPAFLGGLWFMKKL